MKLFSLTIMYKTGTSVQKLSAATELSQFGYFQRGSIKEFMEFTSKVVIERIASSQRASIKEQDYMCHVYVRGDGLSSCLISDFEYPNRVAFTLMNKLLDDFGDRYPSSSWNKELIFNEIETMLQKYQARRFKILDNLKVDPKEADSMTKIQCNLDDTKIILHDTIESLLQRGEKLDDLVGRSEDLSMQSKAFYKTARKTNQCCSVL